jgi:hypothetical protein
MITPVLEQNFVTKGMSKVLNLNGSEIEVHENFRLYLITKIGNPKYTPEVFASTVVINYSVTPDGLKDQLLNKIVDYQTQSAYLFDFIVNIPFSIDWLSELNPNATQLVFSTSDAKNIFTLKSSSLGI